MLKVAKTNIQTFVGGLDAAANRYNELIDNIDRLVEIANYYNDFIDECLDDIKNGYKLITSDLERVERCDRIFNERVAKINETREDASFAFLDFEENYGDEDFFESLFEVETANDDEDDEAYVYGEDFDELAYNVYDLVNELKFETSDYSEGSYIAVQCHVNEVNDNNVDEYGETKLFELSLEDETLSVDLEHGFQNRIEYIKKLLK